MQVINAAAMDVEAELDASKVSSLKHRNILKNVKFSPTYESL